MATQMADRHECNDSLSISSDGSGNRVYDELDGGSKAPNEGANGGTAEGVLDEARAQVVIADWIAQREPFPEEMVGQEQQKQQQDAKAKLGRRWSARGRRRPPALELQDPSTTTHKGSPAASPRLSPLVASVVRTASRLRPRAKRTQSTNDVANLTSIAVDSPNSFSPTIQGDSLYLTAPRGPTRSNSASSAVPSRRGTNASHALIADENLRPSFDSQEREQRQPRKLVRKSLPLNAQSKANPADGASRHTPSSQQRRASQDYASTRENSTNRVAPSTHAALQESQRKRGYTRSSGGSSNREEDSEAIRKAAARRSRRLASDPSIESVVDEHGYIHYNSRSFDVVSRKASRPLPARTQSDTSELERQKRNLGAGMIGASQSSIELDRIDEQNEDSPIHSRTMSQRKSQRNLRQSDGRTRTPSSNATAGRSTIVAGLSRASSPARSQIVSPRSSQSLRLRDVVMETSSSEAEEDDQPARPLAARDLIGRVSPTSTPELVFGRHYRRHSIDQSHEKLRPTPSALASSSQEEEESSSSSLTWNSADEGLSDLDNSRLRKPSVDARILKTTEDELVHLGRS
ncbi:hypothetical protein OIV83_002257 [Microbotryomycetes sp. JL201]|nr:hypothetical protein OIV83_002257 [Microbotryomycetes sp. JL201]